MRKVLAGLLGAGFILAAAGCQSGDMLSLPGSKAAPAEPAQPKVLTSELLSYCPKVILREGTAVFNRYTKAAKKPKPEDGVDPAAPDPATLAYQASISDVTRSCSYANGSLTMTVAVAGKVVPGPAVAPGPVTLPIRVVATQDGNVLYTQLHQYQVALNDPGAAVQFVFSDPAVSMPNPQQPTVLVYAGFDDGPPPKKK